MTVGKAIPGNAFLPYGRQTIEDDDIAAVAAALRQDLLTTGPAVAAFEQEFARRTGAGYAVACANGTAALHLAALALGLGPGDAVVVPTITFLATANAARFVGAEVVFADVDAETGLLTAAALERAITRCPPDLRLRAVFPVHLNGQPCDLAAIGEVASRNGMAVVEDACHALGGSYAEHSIGDCSHAAMACFSMHPVKAVAMGEGGAVTTNDAALAERLARFRSHGMVRTPAAFENADMAFDGDGQPNPWYYEMPEIGFNYRISDINCALGLSQLGKLDRFLSRRRELAELYDAKLRSLAPTVRPIRRVAWGQSGWHLYPVKIDFTALRTTRGAFMRALSLHNVGTQVHYIPVHTQPYYAKRYGVCVLEGAAAYYDGAMSLPFFAGMSSQDLDRVCASLEWLVARR